MHVSLHEKDGNATLVDLAGNIRHGFVYERVPHVTLKSIANNAEIDVIWEHWQAKLDPLREKLNTALKKPWQEWEIPRNADKAWPETAKTPLPQWWEARISRQKRRTSPSRPKPSSRALELISSGRSRRCLISVFINDAETMKARPATVQSVVSVLALGLAVLGALQPRCGKQGEGPCHP